MYIRPSPSPSLLHTNCDVSRFCFMNIPKQWSHKDTNRMNEMFFFLFVAGLAESSTRCGDTQRLFCIFMDMRESYSTVNIRLITDWRPEKLFYAIVARVGALTRVGKLSMWDEIAYAKLDPAWERSYVWRHKNPWPMNLIKIFSSFWQFIILINGKSRRF